MGPTPPSATQLFFFAPPDLDLDEEPEDLDDEPDLPDDEDRADPEEPPDRAEPTEPREDDPEDFGAL